MSEFNIEDLDSVILEAKSSLVQMLALQLQKEIKHGADMAVQLANAESKCMELAAENAELKATCDDRRTFIMNGVQLGYIQVPTVETDPALETIRTAVSPQAPTQATDAFLAEVRASELDILAGVAETMLIKFSNQQCSSDMHEVVGWKMVLQQASSRAAKLRKGGAL